MSYSPQDKGTPPKKDVCCIEDQTESGGETSFFEIKEV